MGIYHFTERFPIGFKWFLQDLSFINNSEINNFKNHAVKFIAANISFFSSKKLLPPLMKLKWQCIG